MIGTTLHEFTMSTYVPAFRTITKEKAVEFLKQRYGDRTDDFLAAFEKAYPGYQPKDLVDVDFVFRPGAVEQARLKAAQQGAPVYMYMFAWESPVLDGMFRSTHCMEIPFAFNNAVVHASMTGGGAEAQALAEKMSGAWLNFARTGNPNAEGCLYRRGRSHDVLQQPLRGEAPPRQGVAGGGTGVPYTGILRL